MGNSGFYGYWASWDLHLVGICIMYFRDSLGTTWAQEEHRGTWKQLEGLGRQAPFQPFSGDADLRSPPFGEAAAWSTRIQGGGVRKAPPTGCDRYRELYKS